MISPNTVTVPGATAGRGMRCPIPVTLNYYTSYYKSWLRRTAELDRSRGDIPRMGTCHSNEQARRRVYPDVPPSLNRRLLLLRVLTIATWASIVVAAGLGVGRYVSWTS